MAQSLRTRREESAAERRVVGVHDLVGRHARERPDDLAVVCGDQRLSFGELDGKANRLARYLRRHGVDVEDVVGILLPRSAEGVVAMLGVLRAGAAYLPLDPAYPPARLAFIVADATPAAVLTDGATAVAVEDIDVARLVLLDAEAALVAEEPSEPPAVELDGDNAAYLIYTSGSTGVPKAVTATHANVVNIVHGEAQDYVRFAPGGAFLGAASPAFDAATFEVWGALCNGSAVVLVPDRVPSAAALRRAIGGQGARTALITTSLFNVIAEDDPLALDGLEELLVGGEAASVPHLERVVQALPGLRLANAYGPTEATVVTTCHPLPPGPIASPVPIGRPLGGVYVRVLDEDLLPVEDGSVGELCIGGRGVARGYHRRPAVTAERFVPDPLADVPGARLYRSGDLVRRRPDGVIEFVGRCDEQVKIRGHRVEPGEIEATLLSHSGVAHAVVVAAAHDAGYARLVAYVVGHDGSTPAPDELRAHVRARLPEHMVPHAFVSLRALPLTPNGKLDREALPPPPPSAMEGTGTAGDPVTEILAGIWAEVLQVDDPAAGDDFFALGGDSLLSVRVAGLAERRGLTLPAGAVYAAPKLGELAAVVRTASSREAADGDASPPEPFALVGEAARALVPPTAVDAYPITALQAGMLFHSDFAEGSGVYHDVVRYRLEAPWDESALRDAVAALVDRHAVLRTTFDLHAYGEPLQLVHRHAAPAITVTEGRRRGRRVARRHDRFALDEAARGFEWRREPPFRVFVERLGPDAFDIVASFHHALLDGWSVTLLFHELVDEYRARLHGWETRAPSATAFARYVELEVQARRSGEARQFWAERLLDAPSSQLACSAHDPKTMAARHTASSSSVVPPEVFSELRVLARRLHIPLKAVFLAAHTATVARTVQRDEVVTGVISHGRPEEDGGDRTLGLFLNTLPLRVEVAGRSWADLALQLYEAERAAHPYRRYPLAHMLPGGGNELFDWAFNYTHFDSPRVGEGVRAWHVDELSCTSFPLATDVVVRDGECSVALTVDTRVVTAREAARLTSALGAALEAVAHHPTEAVGRGNG